MKKPRDFDKVIELISSIDDASKPYDGPITIIKPTFESRIKQIALRRTRMKKLLEERGPWRAGDLDWDRIENFLGYGNVNAPVVIIGMEEGLADEDKLKSDLLYRSTFAESVMDVYESHLGLARGQKLFGDRPRGQRTWRVMADIMLHFEDEIPKDKQERANRRKRYRANVLGDKHELALLLDTPIASWKYQAVALQEIRSVCYPGSIRSKGRRQTS